MTQKLAYSCRPKEQAYFPFGKEKGKNEGKGKFPFCPSCSPLENRRQRTEELKAKIESDVYGREGYWVYDRERAMSPPSLSPENRDTCTSNEDTTTHFQPTGKGRHAFRSQRLQ